MFAIGLALVGGAMWTWFHLRAFRTAMHLFGVVVFVDFLALSLAGIGASDPVKWRALVREDGVVEWATVFVLVVAAALYFYRAFGGRQQRDKLLRLSEVGLGVFCAFVAGEEISWGQRLFGFAPPRLFLEETRSKNSTFTTSSTIFPLWGEGGLRVAT